MVRRGSSAVQSLATQAGYNAAMRTRLLALVAVAVTAVTLATASAAAPAPPHRPPDQAVRPIVDRPIVIGHRGASGYRPEHTLASYSLAIALGADYVEPDLVSTKDHVLVARHENEIGGTTDVASHPEFADRHATKVIDGVTITGWFTEDFTLAELKTLRAKERLPAIRPANTTFDGQFEIPTFQEVLDLVAQANADRRHADRVGVYPETKHPTYFDSIGLSLEEPLVATLEANGYRNPNDRAFIQSFEVGNLRQLDTMTRLQLVQLFSATGQPFDFAAAGNPTTYAQMATPDGLAEVATYAEGIGADKTMVIPVGADGNLATPTPLVADAHRQHLIVHIYTLRAENNFVPPALRTSTNPSQRGNVEAEFAAYWAAGIDGLFSDNPDIAVGTRAAAHLARG
jgi:glycerophosphoryl diester phosphodiesterase